MEILDRLREKDFLFVTADGRNKFKRILYSIEAKQSIALAPNSTEPKEYREAIQELYQYLSNVQNSLTNDEAFTRPHVYTGLIERIKAVIAVISVVQPESIFRLLNRLLTIKKEIEKLLENLRN